MNLAPIIVASLSGLLLGGGWWVFVDGVIHYHNHPHLNTTSTTKQKLPLPSNQVVPGLLATLSMILMNTISVSQVSRLWEGRLWLFATLTIGLLGFSLSVWILTQHFGGQEWPGVSLVVQTLLLLMGGVLYFLRFGCEQGDSSLLFP